MIKYNYHCHTQRCHHAFGSDEAFVQAAIGEGYRVLGFSDHIPFPYKTGYQSHIRMSMEELPDYLASIAHLKEKYAGEITLHTGFEAEWFPEYGDYLRGLFDQGVEYMILGQHYPISEEFSRQTTVLGKKDDGALRYADAVAEALQTGLFSYLAHPDLFMKYRPDLPIEEQFTPACERVTDTICQAALEAGVPLEFNLLGQLEGVGYPSNAFWEYARKWNNPVIFGVDAHSPAELTYRKNIRRGFERVEALGYTIWDRLPMDADR